MVTIRSGILVSLVMTVAACPLLLAQQPARLTPEDILSIRQIDGDLRLSSDGKQVAFTLTEPVDSAHPDTPPRADIWIVPADGSLPAHRFPASGGSDESPRWSPDARSLAFLSRRKTDSAAAGLAQIYVASAESERARRLTSAASGVDRFAWSPDGTVIAYTSGGRLFSLVLSGPATAQAIGDTLDVRELAWSPDGHQLALAVSPGAESPQSPSLSLVVLDRARHGVVRILSKSVADIGGLLRWSPDGKWITFVENAPSAFGAWLALAPAAGGPVRGILKDDPATIWQVEWLSNGQLMAEAVRGTDVSIFTIDFTTGATNPIATPNAYQGSYGFSTDGRTTAFVGQTSRSADDIWIANGSSSRRITTLNPQTASWALGTVRTMTWTNPRDGARVSGVVVLPSAYVPGRAYPTIVEAHPADLPWWPGFIAKWWAWGQLLASDGYVVLLPNTRGVTGQGWRMHEHLADWGGLALDDLLGGVDELVRQGIADPNRLGIGGWSNGGFMTEWTITHTARFKAAVAKSAHADFFTLYATSPSNRPYIKAALGGSAYDRRAVYESHSPITFVRECRTPTLLIYGANDSVSPSQGQEFYTALKEQGVDTDLVIYPGEGHGLRLYAHQIDLQRRMVAWFDKYLK